MLPVAVAIIGGAAQFNIGKGGGEIFGHLVNAILSAAIVALLEEVLFRGGVLGMLRKIYGWNAAIVISSALYSIVHFFSKIESLPQIHWYSGFIALGMMLRGFTDFNSLIPGFLNLFLAGAILGLFYKRTGNIYYSIGVHAGWIFWLKTYKFFAVFSPQSNQWFFGTSKLIDGWVAFFALSLAFAGVVIWKKNDIPSRRA